jgi:hypothetical protein
VLGPQQLWLCKVEHKYVIGSPEKKIRLAAEKLEMSPSDKIKSIKGE